MSSARISKIRNPAKSPNATPSPPAKVRKQDEMEKLMKDVKLMMKKVDDDMLMRQEEAKKEKIERKEDMMKLEGLLTAHRESWEAEKKVLLERQDKLEDRLDRLEKAERKNNIIVSNYKPREAESRKLAKEIEGMLSKKIGEPVRVESAYSFKTALGERQVVRMGDFEDKLTVMKNKKKFFEEKESKKLPIYVDDDLTTEERKIQKKARDFARIQREEGKVVKIGYKKVYVAGVEMRWTNEETGFVEFCKKN